MIPSRPTPPPAAPPESIPARLARLRSEQRASSRPRFSAGFSTASSSTTTPRWLNLSDDAPLRPVRRAEGRRGTAGPPPPPSWTIGSGGARNLGQPDKAVHGRPSVRIRPDVTRKELVAPLLPSGERAADAVPSLFAVAGGVVAADLARGSGEVNEGSVLMEHVAYLPTHLKLRLLDVFADWSNDYPLTNEGARQLLRTDVDELEQEGADGTDGDNDDDEGWDRDIPDVEATGLGYAMLDDFSPLATSLTRLNLSFSTITIGTLRSLLLRPSTSTSRSTSTSTVASPRPFSPAPSGFAPSQPPTSVKLLPTFPHLHTLLLTSMPYIALSDQLFDLLSAHLSLRTLSLAGTTLASAVVTSSSFLPRLAAATPNLQSLDVSYLAIDSSPDVVVKGVDWDERWRDLRVLGLRAKSTSCTRPGEEEVGDETRERLRREIWELISAGRRRKRRWIEVVV
ncbi:hypothetical protein JCM5296_005729 [Sporobolomyces johnsonii]